MIAAMVKLIVEMKWNYVSVLYTSELYGEELFFSFRTELDALITTSVCIEHALRLPKVSTDDDVRRHIIFFLQIIHLICVHNQFSFSMIYLMLRIVLRRQARVFKLIFTIKF